MYTFKLNEERLDYEIHVLRKHEEEVVLVKSDQKRKITGLQDVINRLRQRVAECHRNIEKDEGALQAQNADLRRVRRRMTATLKFNILGNLCSKKNYSQRQIRIVLEYMTYAYFLRPYSNLRLQ